MRFIFALGVFGSFFFPLTQFGSAQRVVSTEIDESVTASVLEPLTLAKLTAR